MMPEDFRGAFPRRSVTLAGMRLLAMLGLVALVLVLSACDAPTAPANVCTSGDTVRVRIPLVSTTNPADTLWASSWWICP